MSVEEQQAQFQTVHAARLRRSRAWIIYENAVIRRYESAKSGGTPQMEKAVDEIQAREELQEAIIFAYETKV